MDHIFSKFGRAVQWTTLRSMGNSTPTKLTILIPLVGYLIIFNENIVHYLDLSRELFGQDQPGSLRIPARLLEIYFGLCFVAVGSILYECFCPPEIKRHRTSTEFLSFDGEHMSSTEFEAIERSLASNSVATRALKSFDSLRAQHAASDYENYNDYRKNNAEYEAAVLNLQFETINRSKTIVRCLITCAFVIGLGILTIPALEVFLRVCRLLWLVI